MVQENDLHCVQHISNGYNINNLKVYVESSISKSPYKALLQELIKFDAIHANHLAYKYGFSYETISILHSMYVKGEVRDGIGSQYIKNLTAFMESKKINAIFLVADLTLNQRDGIDLIYFYEKNNFETLYKTSKYALMRYVI